MKTQNKIGLIAAALILILVGYFLTKKSINSGFVDVANKSENKNEKENTSTWVTIFDSEAVQTIDLSNGELKPANKLQQRDFSDFSGLPKLGSNRDRYLQESNFLISNKQDLALLEIASYEIEQGGDIVDPEKFLGTEEYLCNIAGNSCEKSSMLSKKYEGLDGSLQKSFSFVWSKWDSEKHNLFATVFDPEGHMSQAFICNIDQEKCGSLPAQISAESEIPNGFLSPTLDRLVAVKKVIDADGSALSQKLEIYSISDLAKPQKSYQIPFSGNGEEDLIGSVAWNSDGKYMAVGSENKIFLLDVEKGSFSLAYAGPVDEDGDYYWDYSSLFLSPDASFITLIDSDAPTEDELLEENSEIETLNTLKKVDLVKNTVTELYSSKGLSLAL